MKLQKETRLEHILLHSYWSGCFWKIKKKNLPVEIRLGNLKGEFTPEATKLAYNYHV